MEHITDVKGIFLFGLSRHLVFLPWGILSKYHFPSDNIPICQSSHLQTSANFLVVAYILTASPVLSCAAYTWIARISSLVTKLCKPDLHVSGSVLVQDRNANHGHAWLPVWLVTSRCDIFLFGHVSFVVRYFPDTFSLCGWAFFFNSFVQTFQEKKGFRQILLATGVSHSILQICGSPCAGHQHLLVWFLFKTADINRSFTTLEGIELDSLCPHLCSCHESELVECTHITSLWIGQESRLWPILKERDPHGSKLWEYSREGRGAKTNILFGFPVVFGFVLILV